jgi:hypothetical protein
MRKTTKTKDLNAEIRAADALKLRRQHLTWREIAQRCGFSGPSGAHGAVKRLLAAEIRQDVEEMHEEINANYDEMLQWLHERIYNAPADTDPLWAVDRYGRFLALKVSLNGLALGADEILARNPYVKRIVIDETAPLALPASGETVDREVEAEIDDALLPTTAKSKPAHSPWWDERR